jgi:WD40 repeat protein
MVMRRALLRAIAVMVVFQLLALSFGFVRNAEAAGREINTDYLGIGPGRFNSIKTVDIDKDGKMEILFGNYNGYINSVEYRDGAYYDEWQSPKIGSRTWGLEVGDPDEDGVNEVIAGDGDGNLYMMNYSTQKINWTVRDLGRDVHGIAVADVDGDGHMEIVAGTGYKTDYPAGKVYVFDGKTHKMKRDLAFGESKHRAVAVADVDMDGDNEIIIGSGTAQGERPGEGYFRVVDGKTGILEWKSPDLNGDAEGLSVSDIDRDGIPEIVVGTGYRYQEGYLFIFKYDNKTGTFGQIWKSENVGPKAYGLATGDIDGDGKVEIVTGNQPGYIRVFDGVTRQLEWKSRLLGTDVLGIALADIDKDGRMEIIAAQGGYDGKGDFTSAYTAPHIFIIDGKTYDIKAVLGEIDYVGVVFQVTIIILIIVLLLTLKKYAETWGRTKKAKTVITASAGGDAQRSKS